MSKNDKIDTYQQYTADGKLACSHCPKFLITTAQLEHVTNTSPVGEYHSSNGNNKSAAPRPATDSFTSELRKWNPDQNRNPTSAPIQLYLTSIFWSFNTDMVAEQCDKFQNEITKLKLIRVTVKFCKPQFLLGIISVCYPMLKPNSDPLLASMNNTPSG